MSRFWCKQYHNFLLMYPCLTLLFLVSILNFLVRTSLLESFSLIRNCFQVYYFSGLKTSLRVSTPIQRLSFFTNRDYFYIDWSLAFQNSLTYWRTSVQNYKWVLLMLVNSTMWIVSCMYLFTTIIYTHIQ